MKRIAIPVLILLLSIPATICFGQRKAVLVKLASHKSRIAYFESKGDLQNAAYLRKDANAIIQTTINDFEDNFNYCEVYYFIDTNLYKVLASKFDGVLLDRDLKPVSNPVIKNGDTKFLIVYYGVPEDAEVNKIDSTSYRSIRYPNDGLVVLGHDYKRVKRLDHFIFHGFPFRRTMKAYIYVSKHFALDYKPLAEYLQENLKIYNGFIKHKYSRY
ncbi:MAG TPA: hypothetical protein VEB40_05720 [Flavipsychrobacter sp.]|nr:hypothetical protein [Flavipsychrobacter sp.]